MGGLPIHVLLTMLMIGHQFHGVHAKLVKGETARLEAVPLCRIGGKLKRFER
jgi:hypothetical protein